MKSLYRTGFSLVELLIVMAIVMVLAAAAIPSIDAVLRGSNLTRGGQLIADQLALARQEAVSRNRDVEVRFYQISDGDGKEWKAVQFLRIEQGLNGPTTNLASRLLLMPDGIHMAARDNLSPLITTPAIAGSQDMGARGNLSYAGFRFRADGSLDSSMDDSRNYVTVSSIRDTANPPANFYTIQINPLTGKASIFRP